MLMVGCQYATVSSAGGESSHVYNVRTSVRSTVEALAMMVWVCVACGEDGSCTGPYDFRATRGRPSAYRLSTPMPAPVPMPLSAPVNKERPVFYNDKTVETPTTCTSLLVHLLT